MSDLFWPGDHRAGDLMSDAALLVAMVRVETAWLGVLVDAGVAPGNARAELSSLVSVADTCGVADGAEGDGNPVTGLVALLRQRSSAETSRWVHRGLTSQDVIDTALIVCLRDALTRLAADAASAVQTLSELIQSHRHAPMLARTLTQPALPMTVGVKLAVWLSALLDAAESIPPLLVGLPAQVGGAAGTLAAATELAGSAESALAMNAALAASLGLTAALPWHTRRTQITRVGDALVACCDACGHIASDVATLSRPEIGELTEGLGGSSSTMPHKHNPVLSVLIRRAALCAGPLGATLHTASAFNVDERADGAWHAEWATSRTLARQAVIAVSQVADLIAGLQIDVARAAANLAAAEQVSAEQKSMAALAGHPPDSSYLGAADLIVDATLQRARNYRTEVAWPSPPSSVLTSAGPVRELRF